MLPNLLKTTLVAASFFASQSAIADTRNYVQVSGFGSVTSLHSGTKDYGFLYDVDKEAVFDKWSLDTGSSLGLQLNIDINRNWDAVFQAVVQERLSNDFDKSITRAFLRYQASPDFSFRFGHTFDDLTLFSFASKTKTLGDIYSVAPPLASASSKDVIEHLKQNRNAIAYINESEIVDGLKVVYRFENFK